jgi:calcineurin-like phosphoesterase family protein
MIYVTADLHLNHLAIAKVRGFPSVAEHDNFVIDLINSATDRRGELYVVGDFCFGSHEIIRKIRHRIKCKIHLVAGNHDLSNRVQNIPGLFSSVSEMKILKYNKKRIFLCHYPMRTWYNSHYNVPLLHGHSHGKIGPWGKSLDVGLDATGFVILNIEQILEILDCLPNNPNFREGGD